MEVSYAKCFDLKVINIPHKIVKENCSVKLGESFSGKEKKLQFYQEKD